MISTKSTSMHSEHRYWESEIGLWRDDLRAWQHELAKAESEIKQLEKALTDHGHVLRTHASALRLEEQTSQQHEHAIAEFEKGSEGEELLEMARKHSHEAELHQVHRAAHEELKRRHHQIIAHWNTLLKVLDEVGQEASFQAKQMSHAELGQR
jgi:Skp family chaperone for outer membrane proteins